MIDYRVWIPIWLSRRAFTHALSKEASVSSFWLEQASVLIRISTSSKLLRTKPSIPHDRKKRKDDTEVGQYAILLWRVLGLKNPTGKRPQVKCPSHQQTSPGQSAPMKRVHLITLGHPKIPQARYMVMLINYIVTVCRICHLFIIS